MIKIELKGPENTLRVRQVKVLGWKEGESIKIAGQISASVAQQKNCEAETLRVFRLITSQVNCTLKKHHEQLNKTQTVQCTIVLSIARFPSSCVNEHLEVSHKKRVVEKAKCE